MTQEQVSNGTSVSSNKELYTDKNNLNKMMNTSIQQDQWKSYDIAELVKALCKFQGSLGVVNKGKVNPFFNSDYADINDILVAVRPGLHECGLAISQGMRYDNAFFVTTTLFHVSGQWLRSELRVPIGGKKDAQAVGSACTYGRRFGLSAMLGIAVDKDDDANKAVK